MKEYVGCKIERDCDKQMMKLTQPVKIQKFQDKFDIKKDPPRPPATPAEPGTILKKEVIDQNDEVLSDKDQKEYRLGTAILLHMM